MFEDMGLGVILDTGDPTQLARYVLLLTGEESLAAHNLRGAFGMPIRKARRIAEGARLALEN